MSDPVQIAIVGAVVTIAGHWIALRTTVEVAKAAREAAEAAKEAAIALKSTKEKNGTTS